LAAALLLAPGVAQATTPPSISLSSQSGSTYDYVLNVGDSVTFPAGAQVIVLSGLSGVTDASAAGILKNCFSASHTATSVTFSAYRTCEFDPETYGALFVASSVTTTGTVNWAIENSSSNASGTVQGPVAPGPDFSDLLTNSQGVGPGTSLADKVTAAQSEFQSGEVANACGTLGAYINQVKAQTGKKINPTTAQSLITEAQQVQAAIPCT
jgi:hypothetical protein